MKKMSMALLLALAAPVMAAGFDKPGYITKVENGRLWVFAEGSKELTTFEQHGEPAISVSKIGEGPEGMTLRGPSMELLDAYLTAK